jgi:integrase
MWLAKIEGMAAEDRRSPGAVETYRRMFGRHAKPALEELRLAEVLTPVVDRFIATVKEDVGAPSARTCKTIVSGVMGLAVRYGAVTVNPVREVERVEGLPKKEPRALIEEERVAWVVQLAGDEDAVRKDLPDLAAFMLATGARMGETLALLWSEVDLEPRDRRDHVHGDPGHGRRAGPEADEVPGRAARPAAAELGRRHAAPPV